MTSHHTCLHKMMKKKIHVQHRFGFCVGINYENVNLFNTKPINVGMRRNCRCSKNLSQLNFTRLKRIVDNTILPLGRYFGFIFNAYCN